MNTHERKPGLAPGLGRAALQKGLPKITRMGGRTFHTLINLTFEERTTLKELQLAILKTHHANLNFNDLVRCALHRLRPHLAAAASVSPELTLPELQALLMGQELPFGATKEENP